MRIALMVIMISGISFFTLFQNARNEKQDKIDLILESRASKGKVGKPYEHMESLLSLLPVNTKGKVIYINFWFKECPACVAEFEGINKLYDMYATNKKVQVTTLTFENAETITQMKNKYHIRFPIIRVNRKECDKLNIAIGYPTNLIINSEGNVVYVKSGGTTNSTIGINYMLNRVAPLIQQQVK